MISVEAARQLYARADSAHDFDHVLRVLALAVRIGHVEGADMEIVRAAALLHDVGRPRARAAGLDHATVGAEMARTILAQHDVAAVDAVAEAIRTHRFRSGATPATLEAQVLFDADKLDAIGAVGVARAFAHGAIHGQRLWAPADKVEVPGRDQLDDNPVDHTPVHEFVVKLSRIREVLCTDAGRSLAADRHAFMAEFFKRFDQEVKGER